MSRYRESELYSLQGLGLGVALAVLAVGLLLPAPSVDLHRIQLVVAVFLATVILWVTKPVPYEVASLLCVVLLYTLGLAPTIDRAVSGFASNLVFFLVLLLLIGRSVAKVDLDEAVARKLVSPDSTPERSVRRLIAAVVTLVFVMPSGLARSVTFMPIIDRINDRYELGPDSQFRKVGYYLIGHLNPVGSLALMTGGGAAIVTSEMIHSLVEPISWIKWGVYMAPPIVALLVSAAFIASLLFDVDASTHVTRAQSASDEESVEDGSPTFTPEQRLVVTMLGTAILLWIAGSFLGIPTIAPAMLVVFVFSLPAVRIITAEDVKSINWGIIFIMGAMLSLLEVMRDVNVFETGVDVVAPLLPMDISPALLLVTIFAIALLVRGLFSSIAVTYVIVFPIILELTALIGVDPLYVGLSLIVVLMSSTYLPFNNPTVLIAYERGPLGNKEVFGLGMLTLACATVIVTVCWVAYWPLLDGLFG